MSDVTSLDDSGDRRHPCRHCHRRGVPHPHGEEVGEKPTNRQIQTEGEASWELQSSIRIPTRPISERRNPNQRRQDRCRNCARILNRRNHLTQVPRRDLHRVLNQVLNQVLDQQDRFRTKCLEDRG